MKKELIEVSSEISYRNPTFKEGKQLHKIAKSCPNLDLNSQYYYYLMCKDFNKTSVIATYDNEIIGYIIGYAKPCDLSCLFLWQGAVISKFRNNSISTNMILWLVSQIDNINSIESTISTSNTASIKLVEGVARKINGKLNVLEFLNCEDFENDTHEKELLYRIDK